MAERRSLTIFPSAISGAGLSFGGALRTFPPRILHSHGRPVRYQYLPFEHLVCNLYRTYLAAARG